MRFYPIARTFAGWGEPVTMPAQDVRGKPPTAVITRVLKARFGSHLLADVKRAVGRWTVFRSDRGQRVRFHVEMNKTTLDALAGQMQAAGIPEGTCIELCTDFGYVGRPGHRRIQVVNFKAWRKEGDSQWQGGECASPRWVARRCRGQVQAAPPAPPPTPPPAPPISGYFAEAPDHMGYYAEAPEMMGYYGEMPDAIGYVYAAPEMNGYGGYGVGYIADPPPGFVEGYGYYAEAPEAVGYYAEAPEFAGVGYVYEAPDSMGYYAEGPEMGYYAEAPDMGYYAEAPDMGYYAEAPDPMGYYAEAPEMGYYAEAPDQMGYYAESPDVMGYDEAPEMGYFAEAPFAPVEGYVRERDSAPRVAPLDNINGVEGYYRPRSINPSCETIRPPEDEPKPSTGWFQPLW
jgi:hypothetical protein